MIGARAPRTAAGSLALGFGLVGVVLRLRPTVPKTILAARAFGKDSPRLVASRFGPAIRDREARGAIRARRRALACAPGVGASRRPGPQGLRPGLLLGPGG